MVYQIEITGYSLNSDAFQVIARGPNGEFNDDIPAFLMPTIARGLCNATEDLPLGLIGQTFTIEQ